MFLFNRVSAAVLIPAAAATILSPVASSIPSSGPAASGNVTIALTGDNTLTLGSPEEIYFAVNEGYSMVDNTEVKIKFDDGIGYSDTSTQFTGVVGRFDYRADNTDNTYEIQFECVDFEDSTNGSHWLRAVTRDSAGNSFSGKSESNITIDSSACTQG